MEEGKDREKRKGVLNFKGTDVWTVIAIKQEKKLERFAQVAKDYRIIPFCKSAGFSFWLQTVLAIVAAIKQTMYLTTIVYTSFNNVKSLYWWAGTLMFTHSSHMQGLA